MLQEGPTEPSALRIPSPALPSAPSQAAPTVRETMLTLADQLLVLFDEIPSGGR